MNNTDISSFLESFNSGRCSHAQDYLGAHPSQNGITFRVWAPNALGVAVAGDFNSWSIDSDPMGYLSGGVWECTVPEALSLSSYKFVIFTRDGQTLWKADPFGVYSELRPATASRLFPIDGFQWSDEKWLAHRRKSKVYDSPMNVYEVHFASWQRNEDGSLMTYAQASKNLISYVKDMGFTHIEFMPLTEYPYDASWGYQCTGYFAASSRFGTPHDLMALIDDCHAAGIGVIMDWVPAHFPKDPHGLGEFDGSRLFEDTDPLMAEHPSWGTRIFDYSKGAVRSFLISSSLFWLERYHIDGLRVDAVASMLYLDYDRNGDWRRNEYGGNQNFSAVEFLRLLNETCFSFDDSILMIAEESTAWPLVTAPAHSGGLGFNLKWNMGWMNDTLRYLKTDPLYRCGCHNDLTFSLVYAFSENFVLPLSHDEVVHMKGSLMGKIPGSHQQKLSTVRAFWAYMLAHPGKKLLFMGAELGQESEWDFASQLPWELLELQENLRLQEFFREINGFYRSSRPLWQIDFDSAGFRWICPDEKAKNLLGFARIDKKGSKLLFVCNFSGISVSDFRMGVPTPGCYAVKFSTDEERFGGNGCLSSDTCFASEKTPCHGFGHSIVLDIPPLSAVFLGRTAAKKS